ncbi:MAG: hypothetical protein MUF38_12150 [Anaerolineae bacterium]|jgi:hypothetical protein|nr:hypothetical protein [Anaerolineae bacterium]
MQGFKQWLIDTYNGLYVIVLKPQMPTVVTVVAIILAMLFGLFWGYVLSPVQYYDGAPHQLSESYRDEWIKLVAAAKAANIYNDSDIQRYLQLVEDPSGTVDRLIPVSGESLQQALIDLRPLLSDVEGQPLQGRPAPQPGSVFSDILGIVLAIIVTFILAVVISPLWRILIRPNFVDPIRERFRPKTEEDAIRQREVQAIKDRRALEDQMRKDAAAAPADTNPLGAPLTQRLAIYTKGRGFDESFPIEDENNVFYGECGSTISKKLGDEAAAIEVWLFDKEDFARQMTKILVSEKAYSSPEIRAELEDKVDNPDTDIIVAKVGDVVVVQNERLLVHAKVVDVKPSATAPNSAFEGMTLQIEAWHKLLRSGGAVSVPTSAPPPRPAVPVAPAVTPAPVNYQPVAPAAAPAPVYTPPMPASDTSSGVNVAYTPPMPPAQPVAPPPPPAPKVVPAPTQEDDPFGGTADFKPIR